MKGKLIPIFLFLVILVGCSGSQSENKDLKIEIITQHIDSWVNLMPGSKHSFFISGLIKIRNNENVVFDTVKLLKCEILQEGQVLYELHPDFRSSASQWKPMNPDSAGIFTISLPAGTQIKKDLIFEKPVSIDLYLSACNKVKCYRIDSIYVMRTY